MAKATIGLEHLLNEVKVRPARPRFVVVSQGEGGHYHVYPAGNVRTEVFPQARRLRTTYGNAEVWSYTRKDLADDSGTYDRDVQATELAFNPKRKSTNGKPVSDAYQAQRIREIQFALQSHASYVGTVRTSKNFTPETFISLVDSFLSAIDAMGFTSSEVVDRIEEMSSNTGSDGE